MRLPDAEIGRLNLKEFDALIRRKRIEENAARLNAAIVASAIYNTAPGDADRRVVSPFDFLPKDAQPSNSENDLREMSPIQQKNYFMALFGKTVTVIEK